MVAPDRVARVREHLDGLARAVVAGEDLTSAFSSGLFDTEVEYSPTPATPGARRTKGIDDMRAFFNSWMEDWEYWEMRTTSFREVGNCVIVRLEVKGRGRASGLEIGGRVFNVFRFQGEKVVELSDHESSAEALAAAA
jgi:SnoaL-like protein